MSSFVNIIVKNFFICYQIITGVEKGNFMNRIIKYSLCIICATIFCAKIGLCNDNLNGFVYISADVNISAFYLGQYPVTNAEYKEFLQENPQVRAPQYWKSGNYPNGKENHPVVFVSYNDAVKYCQWLENKYPNYHFRLPTMEEWEHAAGINQGYSFPWGNETNEHNFNYNKLIASVALQENPIVTYNNPRSKSYGQKQRLSDILSIQRNGQVMGWIDHRNNTGFVYTDLFKKIMDNGGYTTAVNQYPNGKSPYGIYDMSGNTWDWTSSIITAQNGAERGQQVYAIKGGSWYANANSCKITMRGEGRKLNIGYNTVGFRVAAEKK